MKKISVIMAIDKKNGIGNKKGLVWDINADREYFKELSSKTKDLGKLNAIIVGRRVWESIPAKSKPLSNRINCIVSKKLMIENKDSKIDDFVIHFNSFEHALEELNKKENVENIFVIGGSSVYDIALNHPLLDKIYVTEIDHNYKCERFVEFDKSKFNVLEKGEWQEENGIKFRFMVYKK